MEMCKIRLFLIYLITKSLFFMKYTSIILVIFTCLLNFNLFGQSSRLYKFGVDSVQIFVTPSLTNGYYLPADISNLNKPLYAEPFTTDVLFPTLAQDIYQDAGNFPNTIFGGDNPGVLGWGFTATSTIINDTFTSLDFPILLEADFFNRSSFGNYNESYFWLGNTNYTNFNPSTSILPSADVQQGIIIGGLPERSIISHGRNFLLPSIALLNKTHNFANYNKWYKLKVILDVTEDGRLVIYNIFMDDNCVLSDPIIVEKSDDINLNSFKLAICVDDFAKEFSVTKNVRLFELPDVVVCENGDLSLSSDFDQDLCLDFNYFWNLPGSNIGSSTISAPSNVKYNNSGNYESSLTLTNGNFSKVIPFNVKVESSFQQVLTRQLCVNDSIYFNNQWIYNSGLYQQVLTSQNGCDSTITLDVIFQDTVSSISQIKLCQGDSLLINGQWIYEDGNFNVLSINANGCDSISSIIVDLIPQVGIFDTINLCKGDSVFINNNWYFAAQDVTYFDLNSFCPISITSTIESLPSYSFIDNISICPNDSIFYKGSWISEDGSFSFNYKTNLGCDSVFILNTVQIPFPDEPISMVDCDSGIYELTVDTDINWSFAWSNGSLSNPIIFEDDTTASILYTHNDVGCLVNYNIDLPSIPFDYEVPFFSDTIVYPGKPLKYTVDLDGNFWSLDWYRSGNLNCEGCFEHMIQTQSASEMDLIFTHISGCAYYRNFSIDIDATQDLYIPNIFEPESSSGNDKWKVYIPECFMIEMVRIYDRWGNLVYIIENPSVIEWDGTYRGRYLEQGVFTYLISYTDPAFAPKIKSGDVTLIR